MKQSRKKKLLDGKKLHNRKVDKEVFYVTVTFHAELEHKLSCVESSPDLVKDASS